ncbi:MAG: hypothetical protein N0E48_27815, partial [Candidatus Thiodiazotropha endolucinida]|nr:hypothetical protein [Candidatus Thiodiazotropha taylori]MCW4347128.1 hypothetical protein [Candidatus Thiodiazotropha endolucinida]
MKKASLDTMHLLISRYQGLIQGLKTSLTRLRNEIEKEEAPATQRTFAKVQRRVQKEEHRLQAKREKKLKALGVYTIVSSATGTTTETKTRRNRRFIRKSKGSHTDNKKKDVTVINLSSVELSDSEKSLLSKGLGFCPRPKSYDRGSL